MFGAGENEKEKVFDIDDKYNQGVIDNKKPFGDSGKVSVMERGGYYINQLYGYCTGMFLKDLIDQAV